ncbi:asparagine synthase (glutamine-hydrolyzing) [Formosa sp. 3Alg 14/1]|uniref:asparagine synthase (glutamine-hydrolyzing) n=1 Tax=Formosa sp. 3Alg 14/1 TaxID=3382190 RepID=UPI0039BE4358
MCGISGIINWDGVTHKENTKMVISLSKMNYRGPDYSNSVKSKYAVLGHNRLAILDLNKRSNQPMCSDDQRYTVVFNGEIYNHKDINTELKSKGVEFNTTSDTEVLLKGFIVFGKAILQKIRGMFAFVIWDNVNNVGFAARDRFGEKPFYYTTDKNNNFSFASNLQGIVALIDKPLEINKQAVFELFTQQYLTESVIYEGVSKLKPGHFLEITREGFKEDVYWDLNYNNKIETTFSKAKDTIETMLFESVSEQLEADVPVGVYLSGGTDSSIITALASQKKQDVTALTMSTPNSVNDEAEAASFVANHLGVKHKIVPLDNSSIKFLPKVLKTMEPLADVSLIPSMAIAKEASKDFKVMLSGDGADEIFGGYKTPILFEQYNFKGNYLTKKLIDKSLDANGNITRQLNDRLTMSRLFKWGGIESFYKSSKAPVKEVLSILNFNDVSLYGNVVNEEVLSKISTNSDVFMYKGIKDKLVNDFLYKMDSSSMLFSLESRAPYLDYRITDYVSSLSLQTLMPSGEDKELLKKIGSKYIPESFFKLPKKGFSIPYYEYLKNEWGTLLIKLVNENISADLRIINPLKVVRLLNSYREKPSFRIGRLLYSILVFEIWLREFHLNIEMTDPIFYEK